MIQRDGGDVGAQAFQCGAQIVQGRDLDAVCARAVEFDFDGHDAALKIAQQFFMGCCGRGMGKGLSDIPGHEPVRCGRSPA